MCFMLLKIKPPVDVCLQSPFDFVVGFSVCSSELFLSWLVQFCESQNLFLLEDQDVEED